MTERPFLVVKVGGSLVSDKRSSGDLDLLALKKYARLVAELAAEHPGRMVFVAGGGSLGHGAVRDLDAHDRMAALDLTEATFAVKWAWVEALREAGARALPLQVSAMCVLDGSGTTTDGASLRRALAHRLLPVLSGDCVLDSGGHLRVLGSDHVPSVVLDCTPGPWRIVTLTDVPGVLVDGPGGRQVLPEVDPGDLESVVGHLWAPADWDTSGAMEGKLEALARHARRGAECLIVQGDPDQPDLHHLGLPVDRWPDGVLSTRIALPEPAAVTSARVTTQENP